MPSTKRKTTFAAPTGAVEKRVRIASDPPAAPVASTSKPSRKPSKGRGAAAPTASTSRKPSKSALKEPPPAHPASVDDAADEALLAGLEGEDEEDDADSSDDDAAGVAAAALRPAPEESIPASSLPAIARDDADVKRKLDRAKKDPSTKPGVIYLGRIPRGFYEDQMRAYFEQFGDVTRLRLSRNKQTGAPKHYAFIEFSSAAVAEVVAETMHNYLMLGHLLQCKVVPPERIHPKLWVGAGRKPVIRDATALATRKARVHNAPRTDEQQSRIATRLVTREQAKRRRLDALGIDFEFEGYKATAEAMTSARKLGAANAVAVGQGTDADKVVAKSAKALPAKRKLASRVRKSI